MIRSIGAFLAGLAAWVVIVSLLDRGLRIGIPGYAVAEPAMHFTLFMQLARLSIAAVTSVLAGAIMGAIAPPRPGSLVTLLLGVLLLAAFIPEHVRLWALFPVWYHLAFLVPLLPLLFLGRAWVRALRPAALDPAAQHA